MNRVNRAYQDCNLLEFEVEYLGQQERLGNFSLDMFNDLKTKSTFLRVPGETIMQARDRIRKGFKSIPTT